MKLWLMLSTLILGLAVYGEPTNAVPKRVAQPSPGEPDPSAHLRDITFRELKPNEVIVGTRTYSGIAVQVAKTRKPIELINPLAPQRFGGEDNLLRDPITGHPSGWKLLSIQF